jgi:hypothetical protein
MGRGSASHKLRQDVSFEPVRVSIELFASGNAALSFMYFACPKKKRWL